MATHSSWFNLQNSIGFGQVQDQSSRAFYRSNQNSISHIVRNHSFQRQQQSPIYLHHDNVNSNLMENTEHFYENESKIGSYFQPFMSYEPNASQSSPDHISQQQQSLKSTLQLQTKKGLKNLAKLLIRTLKKKKFDSSKYLTEEIEEIIMQHKKLSKNEHAKQSKNIRRRTYDALNVMIAANVLGPDLAFIRRVNALSFTKKCSMVIGQKTQIQARTAHISERLKLKEIFLSQLRTKKMTLQWWLSKKKQQAQNQNQNLQKNRQQISNSFKKSSRRRVKPKPQVISLPAVFIVAEDQSTVKNIRFGSESNFSVRLKNSKIKLFSQIDTFQTLKSVSYDPQSLLETSQKRQ